MAGPGTGKSHTFKQLLQNRAGPNLALTFINLLANDLSAGLDDLADASTFHGYCRRLLHRIPISSRTAAFEYYPLLIQIQVDDLRRVEGSGGSMSSIEKELEKAFHELDHTNGLIELALRSGSAYD